MTATPPDPASYEGQDPPRQGNVQLPDGTVPPPQRYGDTPPAPPASPVPAQAASHPVPARPAHDEPATIDRLVAVSGPVAVILFMVIGFAFDGWAWGWIVFLLPGVLYQWRAAGRKR